MRICRKKETFWCFHLATLDDLEGLSEFLGSGYSIKPMVYPTGGTSTRQFEIKTTGQLVSVKQITIGEWVIKTALGIEFICSDFVFKENFKIIRKSK